MRMKIRSARPYLTLNIRFFLWLQTQQLACSNGGDLGQFDSVEYLPLSDRSERLSE